MKWAYGITTVPERLETILPGTVASLRESGFDSPRFFVDACKDAQPYHHLFGPCEVTTRWPRIRVAGNWVLSLYELFIRNPDSDRYAIFQDDLVACKNLRRYLEACKSPEKGYWNLYTIPRNDKGNESDGWHRAIQRGKGAVALVFNRDGVLALLSSRHMAGRPINKANGWRRIDGGIVESMNKAGFVEYIHHPSLVQHTGIKSSMSKQLTDTTYYIRSESFRGEGFDAMNLLDDARRQPQHRQVDAPKPSGPTRVGIIGYNSPSGLGELNRQLATLPGITEWLPIRHQSQRGEVPPLDGVTAHADRTRFLDAVDTVLFAETPYIQSLPAEAKRRGKWVVCIPMIEWLPDRRRGWVPLVDLFVCPTRQCYDILRRERLPCIHFPWPVCTQKYKFTQRINCEKFLFINGNGGWGGRKGGDIIKEAKRIWPDMPLVVRSQKQWPDALPPVSDNRELYDIGDVLLAPHSVDGLGLEPMEAMASGMPVITTEGKPWNEIPALARIPSRVANRRVKRIVPWHTPNAESLATICKELIGKPISEASFSARQWAESRSDLAPLESLIHGQPAR